MEQDKFLSLLYHDIFEYPLKDGELDKWRSGDWVGGRANKSLVEKTGDYYHLPGRSHLALLRKVRGKASRRKLILARHFAKILSQVPTIQFMGISGSLAMRNASEGSDIDLFIITKGETLWATRLVARIVSWFHACLPARQGFMVRSAGKSFEKDALCLNLWLDEANLTIPQNIRSLYTAHEVLQVVPLVNKENTFEKFLKANSWAGEYWPNAKKVIKLRSYKVTKNKIWALLVTQSLSRSVTLLCKLLEPFAYRLQLWYMRRRRTRELIEPGRAFFHPLDWGEVVMREFEKRVRKYRVYFHKTAPIQIIS